MTKKEKKDSAEEMCVIFVEGDADELIINRLLDYYKSSGWTRPKGIRVFNTHGTPMFRNMRVGLVGIVPSDLAFLLTAIPVVQFDLEYCIPQRHSITINSIYYTTKYVIRKPLQYRLA